MNDSYLRTVERLREEIARLQRDKAAQVSNSANLARRLNLAREAASRATNASTLKARVGDVERHQRSTAACEKKIAEIEGKIARKHTELGRAQQNLSRAEARDREKHVKEIKRHSDELSRAARRITDHDRLRRNMATAIARLRSLPEKVVVLFFAANPIDQAQLRLDEEVRAIADMVRKSKHRDSVKLESLWAVRPMDVLQGLNEFNPQIVHFSGHGTDQGEIAFQNDRGEAKLVSKEAIVQTMMAASGGIRLVFFNTCYSRDQAEAVVEHVDATIGMNTAIGDQAARMFASQFYSAIGFGLSVRVAFDQAKARVMLEGIPEEAVPELFVREGLAAEDIIIVRPSTDKHIHLPGCNVTVKRPST